jgi:hypothetical protein
MVLLLVLAVLGVLVVFGVLWYQTHGPNAPKECPNCLAETYRRTSTQTLASIGTGRPKGGREQVIETFACSNCGHTVTKNRLALTQQSGS